MPLPLAPSTKQSITGGADRWLKISLDLSQPPVTCAVQALDIVRQTPTITFFRPTTGGCNETNWAQTVLQQEPEHLAAPLRAGESLFDKTWVKPGEIELQP